MAESARVWVVLDKLVNGRGNGFVEVLLLGTVARTRAESTALYEANRDGAWVSAGTYAEDKKNGFVRCVTATLHIEQPQSTKRKRSR